jgi:hypothetical protein
VCTYIFANLWKNEQKALSPPTWLACPHLNSPLSIAYFTPAQATAFLTEPATANVLD